MKSHFGISLSIAFLGIFATAVSAADLPEVKLSASNRVPACATPDRLTAYLKDRNPRLNARYGDLAALYKQHGEALGIRWDIAFFQMILETGALRYSGDVRADQNNFAGLGASGGGAHGERFADISTGVKAHLQHLLMYAGVHIDDPVAERTRKVQEWGVLTDWQKSIDGPMTYTLVARQWAPTSRNYVRDVATISDGFYSSYCNGADPNATQEARQDTPNVTVADAAATAGGNEQPAVSAKASGAEIAKRNIEEERKQGAPLNTLGAGMLASVSASANKSAGPPDSAASEDAPPVTLLNGDKGGPAPGATAKASADSRADAKKTKAAAKSDTKQDTKTAAASSPGDTSSPGDKAGSGTGAVAPSNDKGALVQTASIGSAATQLKVTAKGKCKVWTASYGGQRAVIIKASGDGQTNYTVLDVTDANEKREVDAYIAAYAKGGEKLASFPTQTKALTKAFELCPEG